MRTALRLAALVLVSALSATASAREVDEHPANTSLQAAPIGATTASMRSAHKGKKDAVPAKYDVAYPVHDAGRPLGHHRGAI
jgi:hypothetical protein